MSAGDAVDHLSANVEALLARLKMTQKDLADQIGVRQGQVSQILSGKRSTSLTRLIRIAEVLKVDVEDLFRPSLIAPEKERKDQADPPERSHGDSLPALTLDELERIVREWGSAALTAVTDAKRRQSGASAGPTESGSNKGRAGVA